MRKVKFILILLSTLFFVGCDSSLPTSTEKGEQLQVLKILPELKSLGISLSSGFGDANGRFNYAIVSNTNPSVVTASIDNGNNSFNLGFLTVGTSDITISETFTAASLKPFLNPLATAVGKQFVLRVTISEPSTTDSVSSLNTQNALADVSIALLSNGMSGSNLTYAIGTNTNPTVVNASLENNALNLDFLGAGIAIITLVESDASGATGLLGSFTLSAIANDACIPDNTVNDCDRDNDNLTNAQEAALGTDPTKADSDGDGTNDGAEVGNDVSNPVDTDSDGKIDALESSTADVDGDGTPDQTDANDSDPCLPDSNADNCNKVSVAKNQAVMTEEDNAVDIVLMADDMDGDSLAFSIVEGPSNGILTGEAPNVQYTPNSNFAGQDTFTFKVNDGKSDSNIATVTATISQVNDAPIAENQSTVLDEDTIKVILLSATDIEGDSLTYSVLSSPTNGSLLGTVPNLVYTPNANFAGSDSFTFKVNDGELDSEPATVDIIVNPINDAPLASGQSVTLDEDTPKAILLAATDIESTDLKYSVVSSPTNGNLTGTAPNLVYTPNANYAGSDSFTFKANDGDLDSESVTVEIAVNPINDAPSATGQSVTLDEDTTKAIALEAMDVDEDSLTYMIVTAPTNGSLTGTAPSLTYTPNANYAGSDSFTFKVNDGTVDSDLQTVAITINAINDNPVAENQSVTLNEGSTASVVLTGTDIESDSLAYAIVTAPTNGSLTGTAPNLTYTPNANFAGSDSFTFKVNDGTADSVEATVSITVIAGPKAGIVGASSTCASTAVDETCTITISLQNNNQTINGFGFRLLSDPAYFTIDSATEGTLLPNGCSVAARADRNAIVGFCIDTSFGGNGELAIVTMRRIQAGDTTFETTEASISVVSGAVTPVQGNPVSLTNP